eukprot:scaffold193157_cov20-Tisochrysis_lutea.AAC.1
MRYYLHVIGVLVLDSLPVFFSRCWTCLLSLSAVLLSKAQSELRGGWVLRQHRADQEQQLATCRGAVWPFVAWTNLKATLGVWPCEAFKPAWSNAK